MDEKLPVEEDLYRAMFQEHDVKKAESIIDRWKKVLYANEMNIDTVLQVVKWLGKFAASYRIYEDNKIGNDIVRLQKDAREQIYNTAVRYQNESVSIEAINSLKLSIGGVKVLGGETAHGETITNIFNIAYRFSIVRMPAIKVLYGYAERKANKMIYTFPKIQALAKCYVNDLAN